MGRSSAYANLREDALHTQICIHVHTSTHTHIHTQAHRSSQLKFLEKEEAQKREESDTSKCRREDRLRGREVHNWNINVCLELVKSCPV